MAVEIKRKPNENTYSFLRRFSDKVKKGRVLTLAKNNLYFKKGKNKRQIKDDALRREQRKAQREFLIKTGKLEEEQR